MKAPMTKCPMSKRQTLEDALQGAFGVDVANASYSCPTRVGDRPVVAAMLEHLLAVKRRLDPAEEIRQAILQRQPGREMPLFIVTSSGARLAVLMTLSDILERRVELAPDGVLVQETYGRRRGLCRIRINTMIDKGTVALMLKPDAWKDSIDSIFSGPLGRPWL